MSKTLHIDIDKIPPEVGESFGRTILKGYLAFIAQPGGMDKIEEEIRRMSEEKAKCKCERTLPDTGSCGGNPGGTRERGE